MEIAIRAIGNSKGLVLPKPVLAQAGLLDAGSADVTVEGDAIVLRRPPAPVRAGWAEAAQALARHEGDARARGPLHDDGGVELAW